MSDERERSDWWRARYEATEKRAEKAEAEVSRLRTALVELATFIDHEGDTGFKPGFGSRIGRAINVARAALADSETP